MHSKDEALRWLDEVKTDLKAGWTELTSGEYDEIESSNNDRFQVDGDITEDERGLVLARFKPAEAVGDMTQIKGVAEGWGEYEDEDYEMHYGFYLYIWNFSSTSWELLNSHTSSSEQTISGSKTTNLTNYVSGGYIYFLVSSPACYDYGELNVDYVECEITYPEDKQGLELYIRNFNSSTWELLASHENDSDTTISGTKTSNISNYLDGSNYVMFLAYQKYATPEGEEGGRVYTDYTECEITYTPSDETNASYTYDTDLKRIRKVVGGSTTKFIYDGANVVAEYNGENTLQASYITPGLDHNLTIKRSGSTYYYHQDALGSVRNLTDSNQIAQNTYDYYAFGSVVGDPTENVTNDYRFTGRRWDAESSLYYYRARMYAPTYGRFTTPDPIGGLNLYLYTFANPLSFIDPFGLGPHKYAAGTAKGHIGAIQSNVELTGTDVWEDLWRTAEFFGRIHDKDFPGCKSLGYIYLQKDQAWLDVRHLLDSAIWTRRMRRLNRAMNLGRDPYGHETRDAQRAAEYLSGVHEWYQKWQPFRPSDWASARSPEDAPSDRLGREFEDYIRKNWKPGVRFVDLLRQFLREHGAIEPEKALGYCTLPYSQQGVMDQFYESERHNWSQRAAHWIGKSTKAGAGRAHRWIRDLF